MDTIGSNIRVSDDERLTGIEGWLTFALIILAVNAAGSLWSVISPLLVQPVTLQRAVESGIGAAFFLYFAFVIANFLKKKRRTRILATILFGLMAAFAVINLVGFFYNPEADVSGELAATALRGLIISVPMIGYFLRSRRVKNTFVN